jgi:DNA polymerase III epsilon subunit-like protein
MARSRPVTYFCVDVEASGPVPALYSMLSVGAVAVRRDAERDVHVLGERFYVELKPAFPGVDPAALKVCGLDVEHLKVHGVEAKEALSRLREWTGSCIKARRGEAVFVGHNAPFDWAYVNYYFHHFEVKNPFGYKALDTKALAMGVLDLEWLDSNKEVLEKALGLPPPDASRVHRADYDAWYQAEILVRLLDHPRRRKAAPA